MGMVETTLINGVEMNAAHPDTFSVPCETARESLQPGDHAKIGLTSEEGGERFWVKITEVRSGPNQGEAHDYTGVVDNDLVVFDIPLGEPIDFDAPHVLDVLRAERNAA